MYNTAVSKRILFALSFFVLFSLSGVVTPVSAQLATPSATLVATDGASATESATATDSATATISATITPIVTEKKEKDITETTPKTQDKLVEFLNQHPIGGLSWYNPLQVGIRRAIQNGIPANIIVLILLFPVITAVISLARHIIGLKGFGIYTPAVLSVAF